MPQIAPLQPGDPTRLGPFVLSGRLGEGGQGVVYFGQDQAGERAAVKLLHVKFTGDASARSRFARELRAAQRVASFCTAAVLAADLEGDTPYIASEYIDGRSLRETVETNGPLSGSALERLAVGTATALTAIHQAGIVHRDFKPDNVLLAVDGPRVVDFGIARILDSTSTITSRAIGTPAYMAPEQISGGTVGPPADVFSWAGTIAYAATGNVVFGGDSIAVVLNRILNHDIDTTMLPEPLGGVVRACLRKVPEERPTADQILLRLLGRTASGDASVVVLSEGAAHAAAATTGHTSRPFSGPQTGPANDSPTGPVPRPVTGPVAGAVAGSLPRPVTGVTTGTSAPAWTDPRRADPYRSDPHMPAPHFGGPPPVPPRRRHRKGRLVGALTAAVALLAAGGVLVAIKMGPALGGGTGGVVVSTAASPQPTRTYASVLDKVARTGRLTIGVRGDLPGVALLSGDGFSGFEVDLATSIARRLKVPEKGITLRRIGAGDRVRALTDGTVDMVVATYSYDDNHDDPVTFAGPYYTAHADLLVVANSSIKKLEDLVGRRMCSPRGSTTARLVADKVKVEQVPAGDYAECMNLLTSGKVDAVPGDDLMVAGFADREKGLKLAVLGVRLRDQRYAVGLPRKDVRACEAVRKAIGDLYGDGSMRRMLAKHFGNVDFTPEEKVPRRLACR